jgi:hypothetical protein
VLWLHFVAQGPSSLTPIHNASDSIIGCILGYRPLGLFALVLGWLLFKGWRLTPRDLEARIRDAARADARRTSSRSGTD